MVLIDTERKFGSQDGLPDKNGLPFEARALDEVMTAVSPFAGQTIEDASLSAIVDKAVDFGRLRQYGADLAASGQGIRIDRENNGLIRRSWILPSNNGLSFLVGVKQEGNSSTPGVYLSYERNAIAGVEEVRIAGEHSRRAVRIVRSPQECNVYLSTSIRGETARRTGTVFIRS